MASPEPDLSINPVAIDVWLTIVGQVLRECGKSGPDGLAPDLIRDRLAYLTHTACGSLQPQPLDAQVVTDLQLLHALLDGLLTQDTEPLMTFDR